MFNMFRADLRRLLRARSLYVSLVILVVIVVATGASVLFVTSQDPAAVGRIVEKHTEQDAGMMIGMAAAASGGYDQAMLRLRRAMDVAKLVQAPFVGGGFVHVLLAIIVALFAARDYASGYLKNLLTLPHLKSRWFFVKLPIGMIAALILYGGILLAALGATIMLGNPIAAPWGQLLAYLGLHLLVDIALTALILMVLTLTQNKTAALVIGMLVATNIQAGIWFLLDTLNFVSFKIADYGLMNQARRLTLESPAAQQGKLALTAAIIAALGSGIGWWAITKRDLKM